MITVPWIYIVLGIVFGCLAAASASVRGRSPVAWFFIGTFFGVYGLLLLFILPSVKNEESSPLQKIEKRSEPLPPSPPTKEYSPSGDWFFLDRTKTVCGPLSPQMLRQAWNEGRLFPESWVWSESIVDWKQLTKVQGLLEWLQG